MVSKHRLYNSMTGCCCRSLSSDEDLILHVCVHVYVPWYSRQYSSVFVQEQDTSMAQNRTFSTIWRWHYAAQSQRLIRNLLDRQAITTAILLPASLGVHIATLSLQEF